MEKKKYTGLAFCCGKIPVVEWGKHEKLGCRIAQVRCESCGEHTQVWNTDLDGMAIYWNEHLWEKTKEEPIIDAPDGFRFAELRIDFVRYGSKDRLGTVPMVLFKGTESKDNIRDLELYSIEEQKLIPFPFTVKSNPVMISVSQWYMGGSKTPHRNSLNINVWGSYKWEDIVREKLKVFITTKFS